MQNNQSDNSECYTPEILALEMEVEALLSVGSSISIEILVDISNQLINILNTSQIFQSDVPLVANILSDVIT